MKKRKKEKFTGQKLTHTAQIPIRFSEVDSMGIVWHGHYVRLFEDARESFGEQYGFGYLKVYEHGYVIPIVDVQCQYKQALKYGDTAIIEITYLDTLAAKIVYQYQIFRESDHLLMATGETTQVFVASEEGGLQLTMPSFFLEWKQKNGLIE